MSDWHVVANASQLSEALESGVKAIEVAGEVRTPMITLPPGCAYGGCRSDLDESAMFEALTLGVFEVG